MFISIKSGHKHHTSFLEDGLSSAFSSQGLVTCPQGLYNQIINCTTALHTKTYQLYNKGGHLISQFHSKFNLMRKLFFSFLP